MPAASQSTTFQVVDVTPEVQSVSLLGSTGEEVFISFLEQNITVRIGTDTPTDIRVSLEALITVSILIILRSCCELSSKGYYGNLNCPAPRPRGLELN